MPTEGAFGKGLPPAGGWKRLMRYEPEDLIALCERAVEAVA